MLSSTPHQAAAARRVLPRRRGGSAARRAARARPARDADEAALLLRRRRDRGERPRALDRLPSAVAADAGLPSRLGEPRPGDVVARLRSFRHAPGQGRHLLRAGRAVARGVGREPRPGRPGLCRAARRRGRDPAAAQGARLLRAGLLLGRLPRSRRRADRGRASLGRAARPGRRRAGAGAGPRRDPGRLFLQAAGRQAALSGGDPAARLRRPRPQHRRAWRALPSANGYAALALSLRGWLGSEGESDQGLRQPLDVLAAIDWLAKRPLVDRERDRRWSAPRWAARWRCWRPRTSRRSAPSPPISRRPTWRAGARPILSCATISTICAGPRACRCARRSCGWRRSTCRCC